MQMSPDLGLFRQMRPAELNSGNLREGLVKSVFREWIPLFFPNTADYRVRFAYGAAFVAGALERFVGDLAPEFAQLSFG